MTINEQPTVVGVFTTRNQAESAINELRRLGFTEQQIGYVVRDASGNPQGNIPYNETHVGQNAIGGAVSGGVIGGLVGAASSLLIPGFGPAIAGGLLAATLGGFVIGAAAGSLIGALTEMGVPEEEASYYQTEFEAGRFIVTVTAPGQQREVLEILRRNGAYNASTREDMQDSVANPPYAQVGAANTYNQPRAYSQKDPNVQQPYNAASPNSPYNPDDPEYRHIGRPPYNPNTFNNPNSPSI